MPILASSAPDRILTALELVNMAERATRLNQSPTVEGTSVEPQAQAILDFLNSREQELLDKAGIRHCHGEFSTELDVIDGDTAPKGLYTLPLTYVGLRGNPWIDGIGQLAQRSRDSLEAEFDDMREYGTPRFYYLDSGKLGIYPIPSDAFLLDRYVYDDSGWYACIQRHTSDSSEAYRAEPSAGNEETWVEITTIDPRGNPEMSYKDLTDFAWISGKIYYNASMKTPTYDGLTLMVANTDTLTLPAKFIPALIAGVEADVLRWLRKPLGLIDRAETRYQSLLLERMRGARFQQDGPVIIDGNPL